MAEIEAQHAALRVVRALTMDAGKLWRLTDFRMDNYGSVNMEFGRADIDNQEIESLHIRISHQAS